MWEPIFDAAVTQVSSFDFGCWRFFFLLQGYWRRRWSLLTTFWFLLDSIEFWNFGGFLFRSEGLRHCSVESRHHDMLQVYQIAELRVTTSSGSQKIGFLGTSSQFGFTIVSVYLSDNLTIIPELQLQWISCFYPFRQRHHECAAPLTTRMTPPPTWVWPGRHGLQVFVKQCYYTYRTWTMTYILSLLWIQ